MFYFRMFIVLGLTCTCMINLGLITRYKLKLICINPILKSDFQLFQYHFN